MALRARRGHPLAVVPITCAALALGACGDDAEPSAGTTTDASAPESAAPTPHATLKGPYLDGAVSEISATRVVLHLIPERPEQPEVTFVVPRPPPPGVDLEHLRSDAASGANTRIFYRRDGRRHVLRGYTHP